MKNDFLNEHNIAYYTIEYLLDKNVVSCTWVGYYPTLKQIKECALSVIEICKQKGCSKILNDNRQLVGAWDDANTWITEVWFPLAIEAGVKKFAHILSPDIFAMLSGEFMEKNAKLKTSADTFRLVSFENQEDAQSWLLQD